ncbi:MAG: hypothetical protein V3V19_00060 [Cocleimonas sp.]
MRFNFLATIVLFALLITQGSYATPLKGGKYGIELNIPRILFSNPEMLGMSGTFSYFNHKNNSEIAIPWLIAKYGAREDETVNTKSGSLVEKSMPLMERSFDIHYRKFISDELEGFYLSAFTRFAHFDGSIHTGSDSAQTKTKSFKKLRTGFGVGIGYRVFPKKGNLYWGAGIIIGRYIDNKYHTLINNNDPFTEGTPVIIDAELFKFGYAF